MTTDRAITILCCSKTSEYKSMSNVDCYDITRDASTFDGSNPIVAHPPCRSWSTHLSHCAKPLPGERDLAHFCIDKLKQNGGVLEHPAFSKLFTDGYLPLPREQHPTLKTIEVSQFWFGSKMRKRTWLCFSRIDLSLVLIPFRLFPQASPGATRHFEFLSEKQRSHSTPEFCEFLVNNARLSTC